MKAVLRFYLKNCLHNRYVIEISIHEVAAIGKYPHGIKYGMICKDLKTNRYILMDNHHPKGPHIHIDGEEFAHTYIDDDQLMEDFCSIVYKELGVQI